MMPASRLWKNMARRRALLGRIALVLLPVFFISFNLALDRFGASVALDVTEDSRHSLSGATAAVLRGLEEPVLLRLFVSPGMENDAFQLARHAKRVRELLDRYQALAGDRLIVEMLEPIAFSQAEDRALGFGLSSVPGPEGPLYLGLAGTNMADDEHVIPFLAPQRDRFLEYDLTRLIYDLAHPEKPKVGLLSGLPILGGAEARRQPGWAVMDRIGRFFDIEVLSAPVTELPEDIDVLMLVQPGPLDEATLYAIDQHVLAGGGTVLFADPFPESDLPAMRNRGESTPLRHGLERLLVAWGIDLDDETVIGDRKYAQTVSISERGRRRQIPYLPWLTLPSESLAATDPVTGQLQQLNMASAGALGTLEENAGLPTARLQPLVSSSDEVMEVPTAELWPAPNPTRLLRGFEPEGGSRVLAARLAGPIPTAFPEGPPGAPDAGEGTTGSEETETPAGPLQDAGIDAGTRHLAISEAAISAIVVADADLLADALWLRLDPATGQPAAAANNADFVLNALDSLSATEGLAQLRGRIIAERPFLRLREMQQAAARDLEAAEDALRLRAEEIENRLRALREEQATEAVLSPEGQAEIDGFRRDLADTRAELRQVRRALREDVDRLQDWLIFWNVWFVPVTILILALGIATRRRLGRLAA